MFHFIIQVSGMSRKRLMMKSAVRASPRNSTLATASILVCLWIYFCKDLFESEYNLHARFHIFSIVHCGVDCAGVLQVVSFRLSGNSLTGNLKKQVRSSLRCWISFVSLFSCVSRLQQSTTSRAVASSVARSIELKSLI